MIFKIDAKEQFTVIKPETVLLNSFLAAQLAEECQKLTENGSLNFIIDLENATAIDPDFLEAILEISATYYEQEQSFVIVHPPAVFIQLLKDEDAIDSLNYAPTMIEAIDIVSMEILERDLFRE